LRRSYSRAIIITVMLLIAIPAAISPPAHATSTYTPGVKVGDSVTYGQIVLNYNHTAGIPQGLQLFNDTQSITDTVTAVDLVAKTVTMTQTYLFKNTTSLSMTLSGNVQNGNGNLSIFISAGGLNAGEPLTQSNSGSSSFFGFITETVTRAYAGALRTVNGVSLGSVPQSGINSLAFYWDQSTGFLLEASESVGVNSYNPSPFAIDIKVTSTNIWSPSTASDFTLDAASQTFPFVYRGTSDRITLNLTSYHSFTGTASLTTNLLNSSLANPPSISLSPNNPTIPFGGSTASILTFASGASTTLGLYLFTVNATAGTQHHGAEFAVLVLPPDFEVIATPPSLNVTAGGMKTSTITARALGLFAGTVKLSVSSSPLLQASLDKTSVTLSSTTTSVNSTLVVSPALYVLPGQYSVNVDGSSVGATGSFAQHSAYIPVVVAGPDFEMSPGYSSITISPGGTGNSSIIITSFSGFSGTVRLSASPNYYAGGFAVSMSPSTVNLVPGSSAKAIATIALLPGTSSGYYSATVTGVSGIVSRTSYIQVNVGGPDFSITATPSSIQYESGKTVNATITLRSLNGFSSSLSLAASDYGNPLGFALSSSNAILNPGGSFNSTLTISMPSSISPSYFYPSVDASNGTVTHTAYVQISPIYVPPPPPSSTGPDFTVSAAPTLFTLPDGGSANSVVTVASLRGFSGPVSLAAFVNYAPITASLSNVSINLLAGGAVNSTISLNVLANAPAGYYDVDVEASNATVTRHAFVTVIVTAPDFQVIPNVDTLTLQPGGSATPTMVLISRYNFLGTLQLNATVSGPYGSCPGPNCPFLTLSPTSVTLPANGTRISGLTITTSSTTSIGSYSIYVTATNGTLLRSTSLNLNVIGPDFQVSAATSSIILPAGTTKPVTLNVVSIDGFGGKVDVSTNTYGLTLSPAAVNATVPNGGWASFTIAVTAPASTTPGGYYVSVHGINGTLSHDAYVGVIVPGPNFGVSPNYPQLMVQAGSSNSTILTLPSYDGFTGSVTLSVASMYGPAFPVCPGPSCPTISLNPSSGTLKYARWISSNVTFSFPTSATPGYYYIALNATSGSTTNQAHFNINVTPPPATLLSVAIGSDGVLYWSRLSSSWSNWQNLGGASNSQPALCSTGLGGTELVVRGRDNGIYRKSFTGGAWSASWSSPGGSTIDQPACAVLNNVLYIVVRGADNGLYANSFAFDFWSGWTSLSGSTLSPPVLVASPQANRIDLVVRGANNGIYHKALTNGVWSNAWDSPGGSTRDTPAVISDSSGLYLAVRGVDNSTYYNAFGFSTGWSSWTSLGGVVISAPALALDRVGTLHVLVRGLDNGIYYKAKSSAGFWTTSWGLPIGYTLNTPEAQVLGASLVLLVRGSDNGIYYNTYTGISWTGWLTLGGSTHLAPGLSLS